MVTVIATAAFVIVAGTVLLARGMGGEMASFSRDLAQFSFRPSSSADLLSLQLPITLLGFQEQATTDVLNAIGRLLATREAEVEYLKTEIRRLGGTPADFGRSGDQGGEPDDLSREPTATATGQAEPGS